MKVLFDTNMIIPAEPTSFADVEAATPHVATLLGLIAEMEFRSFIHPASSVEIKGDRDEKRRELRLQLLAKYVQLPAPPPPLSRAVTDVIGIPISGSHNEVDATLLAAVVGNAVDFLVTNDGGIHKRAVRLGIGVRVLTVSDALATVRNLQPAAFRATSCSVRSLPSTPSR